MSPKFEIRKDTGEQNSVGSKRTNASFKLWTEEITEAPIRTSYLFNVTNRSTSVIPIEN